MTWPRVWLHKVSARLFVTMPVSVDSSYDPKDIRTHALFAMCVRTHAGIAFDNGQVVMLFKDSVKKQFIDLGPLEMEILK